MLEIIHFIYKHQDHKINNWKQGFRNNSIHTFYSSKNNISWRMTFFPNNKVNNLDYNVSQVPVTINNSSIIIAEVDVRNGQSYEWDNNGQIITIQRRRRGRLIKELYKWYANGQLRRVTKFYNDGKIFTMEWYRSSGIMHLIHEIRGQSRCKKHGIVLHYYSGNRIQAIENYLYGKYDGYSYYFDELGRVTNYYLYDQGIMLNNLAFTK